jgi:hypothetical protein
VTTQEVKRKLAAILSADVKGYSRLIGGDEEWTVPILNENSGTAFDHVNLNVAIKHQSRLGGDTVRAL